jgi:BirA family biotin operon repressor/biotin-[acetyl-CoA-carboxylase] ligase
MGIKNSGTEFGWPHRHFRRCDSTNTRARELAGAGAPHGTVVTAGEQTEGRGRQGRTWVAPRGRALLYSLLLRPLGERPLLPLCAALAVCETAEELGAGPSPGGAEQPRGLACRIKWPNDVLVEGRKLAGILIEAHPATGEGRRSGDDWAVIGVGLNLTIASEEFPPDLRDRATSLATVAPNHRSAVPFPHIWGERNSGSSVLSARLGRWIDAENDEILAAWRARDALEGREVSWDGGSGVAGGVDGRGNLVVIAPGGDRIALNAGEVHLSA